MKRKIALVKVSSIDDRLIPSGLACLQAYLKMNNIPVKVYNFRSEDYMLPKIVKDPLASLPSTVKGSKFLAAPKNFLGG